MSFCYSRCSAEPAGPRHGYGCRGGSRSPQGQHRPMNTPGRKRAPHALLPSPGPTEPPATHAPPPFSPTSPAPPQRPSLRHVQVQNAGHHLTFRGKIWTKPHLQHLLHKRQSPRTLGTSDHPAVTGTPLAKCRRQRLGRHPTRPRRRLRNAHGGLCYTAGARPAASRRHSGGTPNVRQRWGGAATARSRLVTADALPPLRHIGRQHAYRGDRGAAPSAPPVPVTAVNVHRHCPPRLEVAA